MLRKIDCVRVPVDDLEAGLVFYGRVFGLRALRPDEFLVGMGLPEADAQAVLHTMDLPRDWACITSRGSG